MTQRNAKRLVGVLAATGAAFSIAIAAPAMADDFWGFDYCGDGVFAQSASCSFALNVHDEYMSVPEDSVQVSAFSPVTAKTYTMACVHGNDGVTCRGGNAAVVRFRLD